MKILSLAVSVLLLFPNMAIAYSQDPRSCGDPRTQYPSNPPCARVND